MRLFRLLFFLISVPAAAQTFPVDAVSGKIYYAEEVLVKDGPTLDLYQRGKNWFATRQNKNALRVDDAANGVLIGSSYTTFSVRQAGKKQGYLLWYALKLQMEDDRYWYSFTDFKVQPKPVDATLHPAKGKVQKLDLEKLVLFPEEIKQKKQEALDQKSFQETVQVKIADLINDLKKSML